MYIAPNHILAAIKAPTCKSIASFANAWKNTYRNSSTIVAMSFKSIALFKELSKKPAYSRKPSLILNPKPWPAGAFLRVRRASADLVFDGLGSWGLGPGLGGWGLGF